MFSDPKILPAEGGVCLVEIVEPVYVEFDPIGPLQYKRRELAWRKQSQERNKKTNAWNVV